MPLVHCFKIMGWLENNGLRNYNHCVLLKDNFVIKLGLKDNHCHTSLIRKKKNPTFAALNFWELGMKVNNEGEICVFLMM